MTIDNEVWQEAMKIWQGPEVGHTGLTLPYIFEMQVRFQPGLPRTKASYDAVVAAMKAHEKGVNGINYIYQAYCTGIDAHILYTIPQFSAWVPDMRHYALYGKNWVVKLDFLDMFTKHVEDEVWPLIAAGTTSKISYRLGWMSPDNQACLGNMALATHMRLLKNRFCGYDHQ